MNRTEGKTKVLDSNVTGIGRHAASAITSIIFNGILFQDLYGIRWINCLQLSLFIYNVLYQPYQSLQQPNVLGYTASISWKAWPSMTHLSKSRNRLGKPHREGRGARYPCPGEAEYSWLRVTHTVVNESNQAGVVLMLRMWVEAEPSCQYRKQSHYQIAPPPEASLHN